VTEFCAQVSAGKLFARLIDADGDHSYYSTRYLYAISPITQGRYDELHEEMAKQNLMQRMNIPPGMRRVPGASA
jgi:hypothetical protein